MVAGTRGFTNKAIRRRVLIEMLRASLHTPRVNQPGTKQRSIEEQEV